MKKRIAVLLILGNVLSFSACKHEQTNVTATTTEAMSSQTITTTNTSQSTSETTSITTTATTKKDFPSFAKVEKPCYPRENPKWYLPGVVIDETIGPMADFASMEGDGCYFLYWYLFENGVAGPNSKTKIVMTQYLPGYDQTDYTRMAYISSLTENSGIPVKHYRGNDYDYYIWKEFEHEFVLSAPFAVKEEDMLKIINSMAEASPHESIDSWYSSNQTEIYGGGIEVLCYPRDNPFVYLRALYGSDSDISQKISTSTNDDGITMSWSLGDYRVPREEWTLKITLKQYLSNQDPNNYTNYIYIKTINENGEMPIKIYQTEETALYLWSDLGYDFVLETIEEIAEENALRIIHSMAEKSPHEDIYSWYQ